jgi:hypothetical protein
MNGIVLLAFAALGLAAIPCGLFLANLFVYQRIRKRRVEAELVTSCSVSVLIPARNEAGTIRAAVESVLSNRGITFEVLVLDDHSTDGTAEIVRELAASDSRVRLIAGEPLPAGWCGKQFACHTLARRAAHPLLVFMDADVRLASDALARMAGFLESNPVALASGVPRQLTGTVLERLLIPLIHFVLLGFLPMRAMRRSTKPKYAAGCGQLFVARREAYFAAGGHGAIRASLHDGLQLPRTFRRAGFGTDLFDATDLASCRMYKTNAETWRGLGKNATEGLAAPGVLPVMTLLLFGGQVMPFLLLMALPWLPQQAMQPVIAAAICAWLPRFISARKFGHPLSGALLHPVAVLLLLAIQWQARWRQLSGAPMNWRGRNYPSIGTNFASRPAQRLARPLVSLILFGSLLAASLLASASQTPEKNPAPSILAGVELEDQFRRNHTFAFPKARPVVLVIADREGSAQIAGWIDRLKQRDSGQVEFAGLADMSEVPALLRGMVRSRFRQQFTYPVMLDWSGAVCKALGASPGQVNVVVLDSKGLLRGRVTGPPSPENLEALFRALPNARPAA